MGKKGGVGYGSNKKPPLTSAPHQQAVLSLRQQTGRPGGGAGASRVLNPSTQAAALRAEHLLRIATWASANAPPLGALFGARLGCLCEAAFVPAPYTPHSICERCESVVQVGVNCFVCVTKNKRKGKSGKTKNVCNYVTYICHFCNHGNSKPGTSKNHLKTKISQVAARANLEMLGLLKFVQWTRHQHNSLEAPAHALPSQYCNMIIGRQWTLFVHEFCIGVITSQLQNTAANIALDFALARGVESH